MAHTKVEELPYMGESPHDNYAFNRYHDDLARGKSLIQLKATAAEVTPEIRNRWSARTFTPVKTPAGEFDAVVCNVSYHFNQHGARFGSIARMTEEADRYYRFNQHLATPMPDGTWALPGGKFDRDGKIITFWAAR
jgi:hypothetical protein